MSNAASVHVLEHRIGVEEDLTYTVRDADGTVVDLDTGTPTLTISICDYPGGTELADEGDVGTLAGSAAGVLTIPLTEAHLATLTPGDYALTIGVAVTDGEDTITTIYPIAGALILRLLPTGG